MEEMTRKQPDVDKVTKTYKRKPAEAPSSLADRRGARTSVYLQEANRSFQLSARFLTFTLNHLQANSSSSSKLRRLCSFLEETLGSSSSAPAGSRCGCWLSTANANSTTLWTGRRR